MNSVFEYRNSPFALFHDGLNGEEVQADAVLGVGGATQTLLNTIPNRTIKSAWDLGCGSGAIAIALSMHSEKVVATDISQRAINYAKLSAFANKITNIDFRLGSMFEPVLDEKFDLVISNPPFVIGGVTNLEHRESPFAQDGLTRELLHQVPKYLKENGLAIFLTAWQETETETWVERIEQMFPSDVNIWVGLRELLPVDSYVDVWLADAQISNPVVKTEWLSKLSEVETKAIAFGLVVIQNEMSAPPWQTINDVRNAIRLPSGEELQSTLESMKVANEMNAVQILAAEFKSTTDQPWRGDFSLDGVLSGLRSNLGSGMGFDEACDKVAVDLNLDPEDVRIYGLAGVKTLVSMGLLSLNTPRI